MDLSSANVTAWQWDFGDGTPGSTLQTPVHTYQSEGTFLVTLIVAAAPGCLDSIKQTVMVEGYSSIYVPNAFTPNDDGLNEFFAPSFSRIDSINYSMQIFDRWGTEIFTSDKITDYWNGKIRGDGELVQEDVYVYVITYRDVKKIERKLIGNVNVVR